MESGSINEACIAFEQSERLESKAGTLLNLAGCYERASRWEDAYRTFEAARQAARARQRPDWEAVASEHLGALRAKVSTVTLDLAARPDLDGARMSIDGRDLDRGEIERGLVLGPGPHLLRVERPGYHAAEQTIVTPPDALVRPPPLHRDVAVANVGPAPERAAPAPGRKTAGIVVAGGGAGALGLALASALVASGALSEAKKACTSYPDRCAPQASEPNDRAATWSTVGTVGLVSGVALVALGAALYFWPASRPATATVPSAAVSF